MTPIAYQGLLVFAGGGIGSLLRFATNLTLLAWLGPRFPWGTLAVNVIGSAAMGVLSVLVAARWAPGTAGDGWRLFLMTGVLGGFTTFSAYSLDTHALWQRGDVTLAALYAGGSVLLSVTALAAAALATRLWLAS